MNESFEDLRELGSFVDLVGLHLEAQPAVACPTELASSLILWEGFP